MFYVSYESFIVYVLHLKLQSILCCARCFCLLVLPMDTQSLQHHLFKKNKMSFLHWIALDSCQKSVGSACRWLFPGSLFCSRDLCLSLLLILHSLNYCRYIMCLEISRAIPATLFFFFKIVRHPIIAFFPFRIHFQKNLVCI